MDRLQFDFPGFILIFSITALITLLDLVNRTQCVSQISAADAKLKTLILVVCAALQDALRGR